MAKLIKEGPMDALIHLNRQPYKPYDEAPPGTLAVSAADQYVDERMANAGFLRMMVWERPDTKMKLTLWRKPGLAMPKKGMSKSPKWEEVYFQGECSFDGAGLFSCCGLTAMNNAQTQAYCCELAHIFISIKPPPNNEEAPAIRIWEGRFQSIRPHDGSTLFHRRLRCWLRLPHGCEYKIYDARLI